MGAHIFELFNSDLDIGTAFIYLIIGICVVFLCLAIIIGLLALLDLFFKYNCPEKIGKFLHGGFRRKKRESAPASEPAASVSPSEPAADAPSDVDGETVAAIATALSLVVTDSATGKPLPFVIRKIRHL